MSKLQSKKISIITNCTSRKRKLGHKVTLSGDLEWSSLDGLVMHWNDVLEANKGSVEVQNLYQGRSFVEARESALAVDGDLYVLSAGLGLVPGQQIVPDYDLTISDGPGSIASQLQRLRKTPDDWWSALTTVRKQPSPILQLLNQTQTTHVWLAMPSTYLEMIAVELEMLETNLARQKLRIFTSIRGRQCLPANVRDCALPYDLRLESTEFSGTVNDFPQRCLRHFATELNCHTSNLAEATACVSESLKRFSQPIKPTRKKLSDNEIVGIINAAWTTHEGSSVRLLRHLRDDAMVSCEQGRFRRLWLKVKEYKKGTAK
jgi:hypothetical protein